MAFADRTRTLGLCALMMAGLACATGGDGGFGSDAPFSPDEADAPSVDVDAPLPPVDAPPDRVDAPVDEVDAPPPPVDAPPDAPVAIDAPACSPCELVPQCGCPPAEACDLDGNDLASGATACRPVTVQGMEGDTCGDADECAAGWVCLGSGWCRDWCASDADCAGDGGYCTVQLTYMGTPIPGAKVCSPACDPLAMANNGCPTSPTQWGCHVYYNSGESRHFTWCSKSPASGGTQGATCASDNECAAGYTCATLDGTTFECGRNARVSPTQTGCPPGTMLYPYSTPAVLILNGVETEFGVCL